MKKNGINWLIITVVAVFCGMLILNLYTPYIADDYQFKFIFGTALPLKNGADAALSVRNLYMQWTGRSVAHSIAFLFLLGNKLIFNIFNTVVFVVLVLLMCKHICGRKNITAAMFAVVTAMAWFFIPAFGETVLWLTGSANYLWPMVLILLFLLPYRLNFEAGERKARKWETACMFLFGILAGWTNENTAGAMILFVAAFLVLYRIKKLPIPRWAYSGCAGAVIGFGIMMAAPGNRVRSISLQTSQPLLEQIKDRLKDMLWVLAHDLNLLMIVVLLAVLGYVLLKMYRKHEALAPFFYGVAGAATIGAGILSPAVPVRAYFGAACFLMIASGFVINEIITRFLSDATRKSVLIVLLGVAALPSFVAAYQDLSGTYQMMKYREVSIRLEQEKGNSNVTVIQAKPATPYNPLYRLDDLQEDKNFWVNQKVAQYYGLQSIVGMSEENYINLGSQEKVEQLPEKKNVNEMYQGMILDYCDGKKVDQQGTVTVKRQSDTVELSGWAADFSVKQPLKNMYLQVNGQIITGTYGEARPAVSDFYKNQALDNTGFDFKVGQKTLENADSISFILVGSDGTYKYKPVTYRINWQN